MKTYQTAPHPRPQNAAFFSPAFMKSRPGFTLVELLVVISIIGILMAILLPVLSKARQEAHKTSCMSNVRQLGMAVKAYMTDNHGNYPPKRDDSLQSWFGKSGTSGRYGTGVLSATNRLVNAYLTEAIAQDEQMEFCRCPGDEYSDADPRKSQYEATGTSYTFNGLTKGGATAGATAGSGVILPVIDNSAPASWGRTYPGRGSDEIQHPSRMIVIAEDGLFRLMWDSSTLWEDLDSIEKHVWHGREIGFNCSFADGHAAWVKIEEKKYWTDENDEGDAYSLHYQH